MAAPARTGSGESVGSGQTRGGGSGPPLFVRALWWRWGASVAMLLVATTCTFAAAIGPLYLRAGDDSLTRQAIASARVEQSGMTITANAGTSPKGVPAAVVSLHRQLPGHYGTALFTTETGVQLGSAQQPTESELLARTGICRRLTFTTGDCATLPRTIDMSVRTAALLHLRTGQTIDVTARGGVPDPVTIVGLYDVPDTTASYWWGSGASLFSLGQNVEGGPGLIQVDALVTPAATAADVPASATSLTEAQVPLVDTSVHVGNRQRFSDTVAAYERQLAATTTLQATTGAVGLLHQAAHQGSLMATTVVVVSAELVLLGLWVMFTIVARAGEGLRSEVALARLRGFRPRSVLGVAVSAPAVVSVLGLPVGLLAAWAAVTALSSSGFVAGTTVGFDGWVLLAGLISLAGALLSVVAGSARLLRARPSAWGTTAAAMTEGASSGSRWATAAEAAVIVLAIAGVVELSTTGVLSSGHDDPLAAVAPGLIAVAVALLGIRLLLLATRPLVRWTADTGRVALFLLVRQLRRRPVLGEQTRFVAVALALAAFATVASTDATANRRVQAHVSVGAAQVLTGRPAAGVDPVQAVDRADPTGRYAMAAAVSQTASSTLLGVDTSRFARVGAWPAGISRSTATAVDRELTAKTAPVVTVGGSAVRISVTVTGRVQPAPRLNLVLFDPQYQDTIAVEVATLTPGTNVATTPLEGQCPDTCRVEGLALTAGSEPASPPSAPAPAAPAPSSASGLAVTITGFSELVSGAWHQTPFDLDRPSNWRTTEPEVSVGPAPTGLTFRFGGDQLTSLSGSVPLTTDPPVVVDDVPATLPAVVTPTLSSINGGPGAGAITSQGLDGGDVQLGPVVTALTLPRVGDDAAMVDLALLERTQTAQAPGTTTWQIWEASGAPASLIGRLEAAGLTITSIDRQATATTALDRSGPGLADRFLLYAALGSLLLAATAVLFSGLAGVRRRAGELVALSVAGVRPATLRRSILGEAALVAGTGALLGAIAGIVGSLLAISSLPELPGAPGGLPLQHPLRVAEVVTVAAGGGVVLALVLAGAALALARRAGRTSLRSLSA